MEFNTNNILKMKVNANINNVFAGMIDDLPKSSNQLVEISGKTYLATTQNGRIVNYENFYKLIYNYISEYIPQNKEGILINVIKRMPQTIKNLRRIEANNEILRFQKEILTKYFYESGNKYNVKEKIQELRDNINELIESDGWEYIGGILSNFEQRMRNEDPENEGIISALNRLSKMLEERGK